MKIADIDHLYYFAYGHNTNTREMKHRAPTARFIAPAYIKNFRFLLKNYADIMPSDAAITHGVLYRINIKDLKQLDHDEGLHVHYNRIPVPAHVGDQTYQAMAYIMDPEYHVPHQPTKKYLDLVARGYQQHDLPLKQIQQALDQGQK
jgi:gamma-glutamylcyclotransferase (GGCT)/AIG2-like uncharacterized protein YtfP